MKDKIQSQREQNMNEYIMNLSSNDLGVYRDIFSSEYVYDVIYNHPERIQKIKPILERMNFIQNTHFVFTIIFDNFWAICEDRDNAYRYQLKRILLNQTRAALAGIHPASVAATLIGTDKVVVLVDCGDMPEKEAERYSVHCAESLRDYIMSKTTFSTSIGVSNYCSSPSYAWRAYEQSFQALSDSFIFGYANILKYRKPLTSDTSFKQNEVSAIAKRFAIAISSLDLKLCQKYTDHLFQRLSIITTEENYAKSYVILVLSQVTQYCIRLGIDANVLSRRLIVMIESTLQSGTIGKLQEKTCDFLKDIIQNKDMCGQLTSRPIYIAHAYIEQFHTDNLSLKDLTRLCGYSDAYFCRLFKRTFHKTYTTFLTECRIKHAKQLLRESSASISEISELVGFHSFSYFCVCFHKVTARSPGEYRRAQIQPEAATCLREDDGG